MAVSRDDILLRGYEDGKPVQRKIPYKPYLFIPTKKASKYKTLDGIPVGRIDFESMKEARDFCKDYKDVEGMPIFGLNNYTYTYIFDTYHGDIPYDPSLISVVSIDIECDIANGQGFPDIQKADNEITLITISRNGIKTVFGCGNYVVHGPNIKYYKCKDELHLLRCFIEIWNSSQYSPDIITGWNIEFFDIPYTINRIKKVLGDYEAKKLSPWQMLHESKIDVMGHEQQSYEIVGIASLDYLQLYKKFAYTQQESYSLDNVAFEELGARKLDYGEYGSLGVLQVKNWQMYTEYNIRDVELVDMLEDKLKLIELAMAMAYDAKINFQDTFTTVRPWDIIIHNYLLERNIVIPQFKKSFDTRRIVGGYVKDPHVGMHNWVVSFDLNSLYPHLIMQYNISPEAYKGRAPFHYSIDDMLDRALDKHKDYLTDNKLAITANMCVFSHEKQGFLPALMQRMYEIRKVFQSEMKDAKKAFEALADKTTDEAKQLVKDIAKLNNLQMSKKIFLNSGYGALANEWNRWYETDLAEAITTSGQFTIRWIENKLNQYLNKIFKTEEIDYVIASDTDSVYIQLDRLVEMKYGINLPDTKKVIKFLDKVCVEMIEPYIEKCYTELAEYVNAFDQKMRMKRECIADKAIWTAKKRYILNVYNQEGVAYEKPKLKMMGIEAIRTSTPAVCRTAIKNTLETIMNSDEATLQKNIADFKVAFSKMSFEQVAFPRGVNDLEKYKDSSTIYTKGTPIGVKGALIYNHHIKNLKLDRKYEYIASGHKIKFLYMKTPNPLHTPVLACPKVLPPEFKMDAYIDYDMQFDKAFLEPIKTIVNAIGWEVEKKDTLDSFFE